MVGSTITHATVLLSLNIELCFCDCISLWGFKYNKYQIDGNLHFWNQWKKQWLKEQIFVGGACFSLLGCVLNVGQIRATHLLLCSESLCIMLCGYTSTDTSLHSGAAVTQWRDLLWSTTALGIGYKSWNKVGGKSIKHFPKINHLLNTTGHKTVNTRINYFVNKMKCK